jgi:cellulose synthase/poly-beta-1,6-N-acetylglucosamine synthase-like glycosyltransferase
VTLPRIVAIPVVSESAAALANDDAGTKRAAAGGVSVIIPTFNERGSLAELVRRTVAALDGIRWEIIIVDDNSPDGTTAEARSLYQRARALHAPAGPARACGRLA